MALTCPKCEMEFITKDQCEAHKNDCMVATSSSSAQHEQSPQQPTNVSTAEREFHELKEEIDHIKKKVRSQYDDKQPGFQEDLSGAIFYNGDEEAIIRVFKRLASCEEELKEVRKQMLAQETLAMDMALEQQRDSYRRRDEEFTRRTTGMSQEATSIKSLPELAVAMKEQFSHLAQAMQSQSETLGRLRGSGSSSGGSKTDSKGKPRKKASNGSCDAKGLTGPGDRKDPSGGGNGGGSRGQGKPNALPTLQPKKTGTSEGKQGRKTSSGNACTASLSLYGNGLTPELGMTKDSNRTSAWVESNAFDVSLEYDSN